MSAFPLDPRHDKVMTGYFRAFYDDLLTPRCDKIMSVLEIGVRDGESMRLWAAMFPDATIFGIDTTPAPQFNESRIRCILEDAYDSDTVDTMRTLRPNGYDLVIDDGPHTPESQQFFLLNYADLVAPSGVLVLEDIMRPSSMMRLSELLDHSEFTVRCIRVEASLMDEPFRSQFIDGLGVIVAERKP